MKYKIRIKDRKVLVSLRDGKIPYYVYCREKNRIVRELDREYGRGNWEFEKIKAQIKILGEWDLENKR